MFKKIMMMSMMIAADGMMAGNNMSKDAGSTKHLRLINQRIAQLEAAQAFQKESVTKKESVNNTVSKHVKIEVFNPGDNIEIFSKDGEKVHLTQPVWKKVVLTTAALGAYCYVVCKLTQYMSQSEMLEKFSPHASAAFTSNAKIVEPYVSVVEKTVQNTVYALGNAIHKGYHNPSIIVPSVKDSFSSLASGINSVKNNFLAWVVNR